MSKFEEEQKVVDEILLTEQWTNLIKTTNFTPDKLVAVDWAKPGSGFTYEFLSGDKGAWKKGMLDFVQLHPDTTILIERTFESFDLDLRKKVMAEADRLSVTILNCPPRQTSKFRGEKYGYDDDVKSNSLDAHCILAMYLANPKTFYTARERIGVEKSTRDKQTMMSRYYAYKDEYAKANLSFLPPPSDANPLLREVFIDDKNKYYPVIVGLIGAALDVLDAGAGRDKFMRKIGYFGAGYGSRLRSDLYFHVTNRVAKKIDNVEDKHSVSPEALKQAEKKITGALHDLFRQVKRAYLEQRS